MPGESYCRWLGSLLLCLCDVFWALINSLVCWFCCCWQPSTWRRTTARAAWSTCWYRTGRWWTPQTIWAWRLCILPVRGVTRTSWWASLCCAPRLSLPACYFTEVSSGSEEGAPFSFCILRLSVVFSFIISMHAFKCVCVCVCACVLLNVMIVRTSVGLCKQHELLWNMVP